METAGRSLCTRYAIVLRFEQVATIEEDAGELPDLEAERTRLAEAEQEMWAWYLEWAEIARAAIKDRVLLRRLGFLSTSTSRRRAAEGEGEEESAASGVAAARPA